MEAKTKRLYEIAKELKVDSKLIVQRSTAEGIGPIETHFSPVTADQEKIIRGWYAKPSKPGSATPVVPPASSSNSVKRAAPSGFSTGVISKGLDFFPKLLRRDTSKEVVETAVAKAKENGQAITKNEVEVSAVAVETPVVEPIAEVAVASVPAVPNPVVEVHEVSVVATEPEVQEEPVVAVETPASAVQETPSVSVVSSSVVSSVASTPTEIQEMAIEVDEPEIQEEPTALVEPTETATAAKTATEPSKLDDASFEVLRSKIAEVRNEAVRLGEQLEQQAKQLKSGRVIRIQPLDAEWRSLLQHTADLVSNVERLGYRDSSEFAQVVDIGVMEKAVVQIEGTHKQELLKQQLLVWLEPMAGVQTASGAPVHLDDILKQLRDKAGRMVAELHGPDGAAAVAKLGAPESPEPVRVAFDLIHGREPETEQADQALVEFIGVKRFRQFVQACDCKNVVLGRG